MSVEAAVACGSGLNTGRPGGPLKPRYRGKYCKPDSRDQIDREIDTIDCIGGSGYNERCDCRRKPSRGQSS